MRTGRLHVVTDSVEVARGALSGGAPVVQVRVKGGTDRELHDLASRVVALCRAAGAVCLVNDRVDVALAVGADGVHLGADDLPVSAARALLPGGVVGGTARDPAGGLALPEADYLGVGPAYATTTKSGLPDPLGPAGVGAVAAAVAVPVIAIGGVTLARVPELLAAGAYGVAVVGAVAADPERATRAFLAALP